MKLTGIEMSNFRSIGEEPVVLNPFKKCNIIVGTNNTGKSNILRAIKKISDIYLPSRRLESTGLTQLDWHKRSSTTPFKYKLFFTGDIKSAWDNKLINIAQTNIFWFQVEWQSGSDQRVINHSLLDVSDFRTANGLLEYLSNEEWHSEVSQEHIKKTFSQRGDTFLGKIAYQSSFFPVHTIPEFRQIKPGGEYSLDGQNLIQVLANYQSPVIGKDHDRIKFDRIQEFTRKLLNLPRAILDISREDTNLIIENDGLRLPLSSYGTGVHELIILITAVLSVENAICCIEEPEIHLHPRLQRALIQFLSLSTTNQYFITTHSPALINAAEYDSDIQVFRLYLKDGVTVGGPILSKTDGFVAMQDLGLRPSDILQANGIIWVEGLSDQIYIRRWLLLKAPDLKEGRDFIFMPYKTLHPLNLQRDRVSDELTNVLKLNPNAIVVIDSDLKHRDDLLAPEKKEILDACERSGCEYWVTDGKEIENYLSARTIISACQEMFGVEIVLNLKPFDEFENKINASLRASGSKKTIEYRQKSKQNYSRKFAEHIEVEDIGSGLQLKLDHIISIIRMWAF